MAQTSPVTARLTERLSDVITMLEAPDAYNREYIAAVCRSIRDGLAQTAQQWQPIETAPKDGTDVLAVENNVVGEAYFNLQDDNWWWANTDPHDFDPSHAAYPTHWMPIPAPPALSDTSTDRANRFCKNSACRWPDCIVEGGVCGSSPVPSPVREAK